MADSKLVAAVDGVLLKVGNRIESLYKDAPVPEGADEAHVGLLEDRGLLVEAEDQGAPDEDRSEKKAAKAAPAKADA